MSDQRLKIAVFIDFDNVEIGVKTTLGRQFDVGAVLEAIKERGEIITKIAYGDWKRAGDHSRAMSQHAVRLVQRVMTPGGDKNGADINLALDALEMAFTHDHINAFVIVGGDSDFITLVEKLKQYDKKVFVVGGRAFTSQVMQKNCTEFLAYENVAGAGPAPASADRQRAGGRSERGRPAPGQPLDQALPLVRRALKVLVDREVSPQLGLLKSTLLQLDSSFSERDYGASTFRDFADKLEQRGFVTLKHSGRTTLVELVDDRAESGAEPAALAAPVEAVVLPEAPIAPDEPAPVETPATNGAAATRLADGVELVRTILSEVQVPPRWPMYLRQMKQFLRNARPDFDERKYGSIVDLMRACQKEGFLRLERDRQGGLRVFSGEQPVAPRLPVPDVDEVEEEVIERPSAPRRPVVPTRVPHGWTMALSDMGVAGGDQQPEDELFEERPGQEMETAPASPAAAPADAAGTPHGTERAAPDAIDAEQEEHDAMPEPEPPAPKTQRPRRTARTVGTKNEERRTKNGGTKSVGTRSAGTSTGTKSPRARKTTDAPKVAARRRAPARAERS